MGKLNDWIKKSNKWDEKQLAKIRDSKYYHHLIDLESNIILFTMPTMALVLIILLISLSNAIGDYESWSLWDKFMSNFVGFFFLIMWGYWSLFKILPLSIKKGKEAKKLRKEYKEKHNG